MAENLIKLGGYVVQGHGSDETVLWAGDENTNPTLTESIANFSYLKIYLRNLAITEVVPIDLNISCAFSWWSESDGMALQFYGCRLNSSDGKNFTYDRIYRRYSNGSSESGASATDKWITKIVGVGRKESA